MGFLGILIHLLIHILSMLLAIRISQSCKTDPGALLKRKEKKKKNTDPLLDFPGTFNAKKSEVVIERSD